MDLKTQLIEYKKFYLNKEAVPHRFINCIEHYLSTGDESTDLLYHKIIVRGWLESKESLFQTFLGYISEPFLPVKYGQIGDICSFYTNSLHLVVKALKQDFMFQYKRNVFSFEILFNDKTPKEIFESYGSVENIVSRVVCRRFTEDCTLNLSKFCFDNEFIDNNIYFHKFSLLSLFKPLMSIMGRDTKILDLSYNNLSELPLDVLNFFIKGDLIGINLSNNNFPSIGELVRMSSKIERLWLEGNPLCEDENPISYVKGVAVKFPRLKELDGIPIGQNVIIYPFWKNYLINSGKNAVMMTEQFITFYFTHYDSMPRNNINMFYDENAILTISTSFTEAEEALAPHYGLYARNICNPAKKHFVSIGAKICRRREVIGAVLSSLPNTIHDPTTFTVDVFFENKKNVMLIIDGVYKEVPNNTIKPGHTFQFRRTVILEKYSIQMNTVYLIKQEMFSISFASAEMVQHSFKNPIRNLNCFNLINPSKTDSELFVRAFQHLTNLNTMEVKSRLESSNWDFIKAVEIYTTDLKRNNIAIDKFVKNDDLSDLSSDDEID